MNLRQIIIGLLCFVSLWALFATFVFEVGEKYDIQPTNNTTQILSGLGNEKYQEAIEGFTQNDSSLGDGWLAQFDLARKIKNLALATTPATTTLIVNLADYLGIPATFGIFFSVVLAGILVFALIFLLIGR